MSTVQIYDLETKKVSTIPAAELAPGMIRAQIPGVGIVFIKASEVKLESAFQHPPFDEKVRDLLRKIKTSLDEVYPMPLEKWEKGFRRDANVEREIALWLSIASKYDLHGAKAPKNERKEIFAIILSCVNNSPSKALETVQLENLSRPQAEQLVADLQKQ